MTTYSGAHRPDGVRRACVAARSRRHYLHPREMVCDVVWARTPSAQALIVALDILVLSSVWGGVRVLPV